MVWISNLYLLMSQMLFYFRFLSHCPALARTFVSTITSTLSLRPPATAPPIRLNLLYTNCFPGVITTNSSASTRRPHREQLFMASPRLQTSKSPSRSSKRLPACSPTCSTIPHKTLPLLYPLTRFLPKRSPSALVLAYLDGFQAVIQSWDFWRLQCLPSQIYNQMTTYYRHYRLI